MTPCTGAECWPPIWASMPQDGERLKRECFALLVALSVLVAGGDDGTQSLTTSPPNPALVDSGGDQSPAASATPTASPLAFYIQPGVPPALASAVAAALTPAGYTQQTTPDGAAARLVLDPGPQAALTAQDRKSTRLNSSHQLKS